MEHPKQKKQTVFLNSSLLVQMAAVLSVLLAAILCTVYFMFSRSYIRDYRENTVRFNGKYMETVQYAAEERIQKLRDQMLQFFNNTTVNRYVVTGETFERTDLIEASLLLEKWLEGEDLAEEAALLVLESGIVIGSDQTVSDWESYEDKERFSGYMGNGDKLRAEKAAVLGDRLLITAPYPQERPVAVLSAAISREVLYSLLSENTIYPLAWPLYIYDGARNGLFSGQTVYPEFRSERLILVEEADDCRCYRFQDDPETLLMQLYSPALDWFFISTSGAGSIQPPGFAVFKRVFPFLMFLLALMAALSFLLVFRVYPPIRRLVRVVETKLSRTEGSRFKKGNELHFIENAVEAESREREQLQKLVEVTEEEISEKLIGMAAGNSGDSPVEWMNILKKMNHPFTAPGKYVLLLYRCQPLSSSREGASAALRIFDARKQVAGFWIGRCEFEPFSLDENTRGAVLRYPEEARASRIRQDLTLFETEMKKKPVSDWRLAWGWGEIVDSLEKVGSTREDAEQALERCLYYAGVPEEDSQEENTTVLKVSREFSVCLNHLAAGYQEAGDELDALEQEILQLPEAGLPELVHALYNIVLEVLIAQQAEEPQLEKLRERAMIGEEGAGASIRNLFAYASQILKDSGHKEQYRFVERAKEYIAAHYMDSMLSLDVVSGNLGVSASYLSTLMTRYLSMGFGEYVSRYRLDQAKRLLERSDIPVQEIGRMTGFNSPQSFGRVFKKYTNETPGRYRERRQAEAGNKEKDS